MSYAEESAKNLYKAMKGFGTDEKKIIREIVAHKNGARQEIKRQYKTMYGKPLEDSLKSEISGYFLTGVLALLEPIDEYEARHVHEAIKGLGTNEKKLIQILLPKEGIEIEILRAAYRRLYNRDLENDISGDVGGPFGRILRSVASGGRPENRGVDEALAQREAQELYESGVGKIFGTDESAFVRIICSRSFQQLNATFAIYNQNHKKDIINAIKDEMSGDLERACLAIVKSVMNRPAYFAEQLHEAMKGMGTKDEDLIRLLVCRSEYDLQAINQQYGQLYGKSLHDAVKSELSGDYEKLFLALINGP